MATRHHKQYVRRRQYSDKEKASAIAEAQRVGAAETARRRGIPACNISRWLKRSGEVTSTSARSRSKVDSQATRPASAQSSKTRQPSKTRRSSKKVSGGSKTTGHNTLTSAGSKEVTSRRRRVARKYTPSEVAQALELAARDGVSKAAQHLGMSRFALYAWKKKAERAAKGEGACVTSGPEPEAIEAQRDEEILSEWRKHPGLGPSQIRNQLRRKNVKVSTNTVRRVMEDAGYRPPKVKRTPHDKNYEAVRPNHLWHLDYVHRYINRVKAHTLILLDDHSRFVTGHGVSESEQAAFVIHTFEEAVTRHGRPEMVMNDKGSAFWSWRGIARFTRLLTELGVDQVVAQDKEWNGKLENFNGNLHKELFDVHRFYDLAEMKRRLATHLHWYNHARTHHALGGLMVPADRYYGRCEEVLAQIEAGHGRDIKDFDLRDRRMDLFKIVMEQGSPEVWLMGHRLLKLID